MTQDYCLACAGIEDSSHTCDRSGTAVAERAYTADAVIEREPVVGHRIALELVHEGDEHAANHLRDRLEDLALRSGALRVTSSIEPRS